MKKPLTILSKSPIRALPICNAVTLMRTTALVFGLLISSCIYAQDFGSTGNTSHNPKNKHNNKDFKYRRLVHWIKNESKGLLIGNTCMDGVTHKMGFEYVVQIKGQPGNRSELGRLIHNLGAKTLILLRNGPFWKIRLNKKKKECRQLTGDHLG